MADLNTVQEFNEQLARKIHEEAQKNPHSSYANKYVGIASGKVVVVGDHLDELARRLQEIEPDPHKCLCVWVEGDHEYDEDDYIWVLP